MAAFARYMWVWVISASVTSASTWANIGTLKSTSPIAVNTDRRLCLQPPPYGGLPVFHKRSADTTLADNTD